MNEKNGGSKNDKKVDSYYCFNPKLVKTKKTNKPTKNLTKEQLNILQEQSPYTTISSSGTIGNTKKQMGTMQESSSDEITQSNDVSTLATDNRRLISPTTNYPYNAIAQLEVQGDGGWYVCSGWFIDKNTVVTAAHCVYDTYTNTWKTGAFVNPARNGENTYPYGYSFSTDFTIWSGWVNASPPDPDHTNYNDVQYDIAVINLHESYNNWFNIRDTDHDEGEGLNSTGYPGDKGYYWMYSSLGTDLDTSNDVITHNCYVTGGMSGGSVFNSKNGVLAAVGLNSTTVWSPELTTSHKNALLDWANDNG
ncbi:trypsin-like serine peptidase [Laceyella putida]|uniref:Serine protease n=1 Tax=Laceyella putida TaxID=110101 RepID=A0ABW2RGB0_9BACL